VGQVDWDVPLSKQTPLAGMDGLKVSLLSVIVHADERHERCDCRIVDFGPKIFEHAECFHQAFMALYRLRPEAREDMHAAITMTEPLIVLSGLRRAILKCIICIETAPRRDTIFKNYSVDLAKHSSKSVGMNSLLSADGEWTIVKSGLKWLVIYRAH
jgi:hypothetical protein